MILFTLDIKKSIATYLTVTVFLISVNYIYSLFSHNITSNYMTYMFAYPLIGGILINVLGIVNKSIRKVKEFHIGKSIINYGIATIVIKNFIKGVFEIAGTDSKYLLYYNYIALILIIIGSVFLLCSVYKSNKNISIKAISNK